MEASPPLSNAGPRKKTQTKVASEQALAWSGLPVVTIRPTDAEREHILNVVRETGWVLGGPKGAAARLGMKRSTLRWKMKRLGISRPQ